MGVSAVGKSTVGSELARLSDARFLDADDLHPQENILKMASGLHLTDDDRWPWLDIVGRRMAEAGRVVVACSALKRSYRDRLRASVARVAFVHLIASDELLAIRARQREGHFMPVALLRSQIATLEPLQRDEFGIEVDVDAPIAQVTRTALQWMKVQTH
jgi:carbohydrate kinase (thermoresistant glucokinase family)